jgi:hypothetical protein
MNNVRVANPACAGAGNTMAKGGVIGKNLTTLIREFKCFLLK